MKQLLGVFIILIISLGCTYGRPSSHLIKNVPYHRQNTDYACGDASMQMVLNYWNPIYVSQSSIMDVMRTTTNQGTLSLDTVRGAQFRYHYNYQVPL